MTAASSPPPGGSPPPSPSLPGGPPATADESRARGCLGTFLVLLAMVGVVGSGALIAEAVADLPTRPIEVSDGVTVTPIGDWEFGGRSDDGDAILLSKGDGSLSVVVVRGDADAQAAVRQVTEGWTRDPGNRVTVGPVEEVSLASGRHAFRAAYTGSFAGIAYPVEGEVTGVARDGGVVLFDGWAGEGGYRFVREEVDRMIAEARV